MKKTISQISLILLIMIIGFTSVFISKVYAADSLAGINCVSSVKVGENFKVSLIYPSGYNITAAQANVTITYSDGTKDSGKIVYLVDDLVNTNSPAEFTAKVAGSVRISVTDIYMYKNDGSAVEEGGSKTATLTVTGNSSSGNSGTGTGSGSSTGSGSGTSGSSGSGTTTNTTNTTNTAGSTGTSTNTNTTNNTTNTGTTTTEPKFTEVNETVYTTQKCNVRKSYSTDSEKITTLEKGTKLTRKGVGDNGWSKVEYNGQNVYVYSEYLTKTEPEPEPEVVFKDTHENLYAKQNCNLRKSWSTDSEKVGYLVKGQSVERTGYADNGWSRIIYNGETVYVASRLLVVEKPEDDEEENTVDNENIVDENTIVENVIEDPTNMSEEDRLKEIQSEIGVLPEVGNNIANYLYMIVTMFAIVGIITGIIYIKKTK